MWRSVCRRKQTGTTCLRASRGSAPNGPAPIARASPFRNYRLDVRLADKWLPAATHRTENQTTVSLEPAAQSARRNAENSRSFSEWHISIGDHAASLACRACSMSRRLRSRMCSLTLMLREAALDSSFASSSELNLTPTCFVLRVRFFMV